MVMRLGAFACTWLRSTKGDKLMRGYKMVLDHSSVYQDFVDEVMDEANNRLNTSGLEYMFYRMMKMCHNTFGAEKFSAMVNRVNRQAGSWE